MQSFIDPTSQSLEHRVNEPKEKTLQCVLYKKLIEGEIKLFVDSLKRKAASSEREDPNGYKLKLRHFLSRQNKYSGAWLSASLTDPAARLSNAEFKASTCRLNIFNHSDFLTNDPRRSMTDSDSNFCACSGRQEKLSLYHCVGCLKDANTQILHNTVQHSFAWLFRTLGVSVCLEPLGLFNEIYPDDNRRPDILLRNPFGGGRQVILDVAVTGIDGSDRKVDDHPDQPMIKRARQKIAKYRKSAEEHDFLLMPFVVSHNGQILKETAAFICRQIEQKLMAVDGRVMQSKKRAIWKLWTRHISMAINKTASRNILRKITKLVNNSNDQQRCASASIFCEDPFSSSTPYAEELEYNIDFLIEHQDIRQCHFPGDQNRAEDRYEEEAYNPNEEGQHVFQSLSPD